MSRSEPEDREFWAAGGAPVARRNLVWSILAEISSFYPEHRKGFALELNAAEGNLGVSVVQLLVPVVITLGVGVHLGYAGLMWLPLLVVALAGGVGRDGRPRHRPLVRAQAAGRRTPRGRSCAGLSPETPPPGRSRRPRRLAGPHARHPASFAARHSRPPARPWRRATRGGAAPARRRPTRIAHVLRYLA